MSAKLIREALILVLDVKNPTSLTQAYRLLGGTTKPSQAVRTKMRELVPNVDELVARNKAKAEEAKGEAKKEEPKGGGEETLRTSGKSKKPAKAGRPKIPRHPKNPFREGSGYGLLLDIIADAGSRGIGKEDLLKAYCKASGKDLTHAKYDLAVINSAREDSDKRHRSCADSFTLLKEGDCFRVRFE